MRLGKSFLSSFVFFRTTPRGAHLRIAYLRNIGAHNTYDVIQDGAEKVHIHERRTTNDKLGHRSSSTERLRLGCVS